MTAPARLYSSEDSAPFIKHCRCLYTRMTHYRAVRAATPPAGTRGALKRNAALPSNIRQHSRREWSVMQLFLCYSMRSLFSSGGVTSNVPQEADPSLPLDSRQCTLRPQEFFVFIPRRRGQLPSVARTNIGVQRGHPLLAQVEKKLCGTISASYSPTDRV